MFNGNAPEMLNRLCLEARPSNYGPSLAFCNLSEAGNPVGFSNLTVLLLVSNVITTVIISMYMVVIVVIILMLIICRMIGSF